MAVDNLVYQSVPENEKHKDIPIHKPPKGFGVRHAQALILFISLSVGYGMRSHLSVTIVAMTNVTENTGDLSNGWQSTDKGVELANDTDVQTPLGRYNHEHHTNRWSVYRTYNWKKSVQEMVMFSFFIGYTSMMLPMGLIAQKYGGKLPLMIALGSNGIISMISPWLPLVGGWELMCLCRIVQGMTQACFYPGIHTMLAKWAPLSERGRLSTYIYTGASFGTIAAFQIGGYFAGNSYLGWPSTFWLFGILSLICFGLVTKFVAASPNDHPSMTPEEQFYIEGESNADIFSKDRKTPWKHIIRCKPMWGLMMAQCGSATCFLFVVSQSPVYMSKVLGVNIEKSGVFSSLPFISMYVMTLVFGALSDFMRNHGYMKLITVRKVANSIGMGISPLFLIAFSYVHNTTLAVVLLVIAMSLNSAVSVGHHINQIDLAPNFAGSIMALGNMMAALSTLVVPLLVSNIVKDDLTNQHKWQTTFLILASFQIFTNFVYVSFAKADVQPWNFDNSDDSDSQKNQKIYESSEKIAKVQDIALKA